MAQCFKVQHVQAWRYNSMIQHSTAVLNSGQNFFDLVAVSLRNIKLAILGMFWRNPKSKYYGCFGQFWAVSNDLQYG